MKFLTARIVVMLALCTVPAGWASAAPPAPETAARGTGVWRIGPASDPDCHFQDIQDAIDATQANDGGLDTIRVRVAGSAALHQGNIYSIDAANFDNVTTFRIIGGHDSCSGLPQSGQRTTLDADGNGRVFDLLYDAAGTDPVRTIVLENLEITGGNASFAGGGVRIEGHSGRHRVRFSNVDIHNNSTNNVGSGGGVSIEATAASTASTNWISFRQGSVIRSNSAAGAGGGLACFNTGGADNPPVLLFETLVVNNQAVFDGGGISVSGCRNVSIRTRGMDFRIGNNQAGASGGSGDGGGIYVTGIGRVIIEASGTSESAVLFGNLADNGGGVAVDGAFTEVRLVNARVHTNGALASGGGISAGNGGELIMGRTGGTTGFPGDCLPMFDDSSRCSVLFGNTADTDGGALAVTGDARAEVHQTLIHRNFSDSGRGSAAFVAGSDTSLFIEGAAVHSNLGSAELMHARDDALLRVRWSTIAGNGEEDAVLSRVFRLVAGTGDATNLNVDSSIVWEPETDIVSSFGQTSSAADCVIGHASEVASGIDSVQFYSHIDPRLRDPANGDLRLQPVSPAVDYCDDALSPQFNDLFNNPRGVDVGGPLIEPPDSIGDPFDIGVHELQELQERLFRDRFETD